MVSQLTGGSLGRYQVLEAVGRGGMATVFRAFDTQLGRVVALKAMTSFQTDDPAFLARFRNEAKAVAQLSHSNIVRVHDFGEDKGFMYLVMEYLTGGSLNELLSRKLTLSEALSLAAPLADALDYAHDTGIVHRDIKPANVLLDSSGNPVLTDFGLARMMSGGNSLTREGLVIGTAEYMSPEQALGRQVDRRSDIYSLGVLTYQMLLGRTPFKGETAHETLMSHIHQPAPSPKSIDPDINPFLEAALLKALAKEPADRYRNATEMVRALGSTDPVLASAFDVAIAETAAVEARPRQAEIRTDQDAAHTKILPSNGMTNISVQQARTIALQHARKNADFYGQEYATSELSLEVVEETEQGDAYVIRLAYSTPGQARDYEPGIEQVTVTKNGKVERRQVLERPRRKSALYAINPFVKRAGTSKPQVFSYQFWMNFLTNPDYKVFHAVIITVLLLLHLGTHYATFVEALRPYVGSLPYFRLHVLHESEFLLVLVYTTLVFRWKGGLVALFITAVSSIPFILAPYFFDRQPAPDELRDGAIQVAFILLMGALMIFLYETVARERERRMGLVKQIEDTNIRLAAKNDELESLNEQLEKSNKQLSGMSKLVQTRINRLYGDLRGAVTREQTRIESAEVPEPEDKSRYSAFLKDLDSFLKRD